MSQQWHAVAKVGDVKSGDVIAVTVAGTEMVLGLDGERYFAMQRRCLHLGGDLADGIVSRGHLICPHHAWRFSTATGRHDHGIRVLSDRVRGSRERRPDRDRSHPEDPARTLSTMTTKTVSLIEGDGIGPEIAAATVRAVEAAGGKLAWERGACRRGRGRQVQGSRCRRRRSTRSRRTSSRSRGRSRRRAAAGTARST